MLIITFIHHEGRKEQKQKNTHTQTPTHSPSAVNTKRRYT